MQRTWRNGGGTLRGAAWGILWCSLLVIAAGCGGSRDTRTTGRVKGKVTLGGQPLSEGIVTFSSASVGSGAEAVVTADGSFVVDGELLAGNYQIAVQPPGPTPDNPTPRKSGIPKKYRDPGTSQLAADVAVGDNEVSFDLLPE